jgi:hypothetical protein
VTNASRDRDRIVKELVGLWAVLKQVSRVVKDERGDTYGSKTSSRFPAVDDLLLRCGDEMTSFRGALYAEATTILGASAGNVAIEMGHLQVATDDNMKSIEGNIEAVLDGNMESIQAALRGDMKGFLAVLEKHLGPKGGMHALMWPLKEADIDKTVDSIRKHQGLLMNAIGIDQMYVAFAICDPALIVSTDA